METDRTIPVAHEDLVRRYLVALLPPGAVEDALEEALENVRYWRDRELADLLAHAHVAVRARVDVPDRDEAAALIAEVGVDATTAGEVLGIPAEVAAAAAEAHPRPESRPVSRPASNEAADEVGEQLRRSLRREDLDGQRPPRAARLVLVATAMAAFLAYLASVAIGSAAT